MGRQALFCNDLEITIHISFSHICITQFKESNYIQLLLSNWVLTIVLGTYWLDLEDAQVRSALDMQNAVAANLTNFLVLEATMHPKAIPSHESKGRTMVVIFNCSFQTHKAALNLQSCVLQVQHIYSKPRLPNLNPVPETKHDRLMELCKIQFW